MYNILTLNKISKKGLARLDEAKYACGDDFSSPDAVIVRSASMHDMQLPDSLLAIARAGAGYNNIPVDKCTRAGICVFNTPGANANAVKELVILGLLMTSRKIAPSIEWCRQLKGQDEISKKIEKGKSSFAGPEIMGKTLGVIGMGAIGVKVANACLALGMNVIGYDPFISEKSKAALDGNVKVTADLSEVFASSDYITVHAPLTDATRGIVGKETLAGAMDGVRVLNFARGGLVDDAAIIEVLNSGKCAAYATDFPCEEMLSMDSVVALPHLGASTPESEENCAVMAADQIAAYIENGDVINSVNLPCITKERTKGSRLTVIAEGADMSKVLEAAGSSDAVTGERGSVQYAVIDGSDKAAEVAEIDGVIKVRLV